MLMTTDAVHVVYWFFSSSISALPEKNQYTTCTASVVVNISASWTSFFGDVSVAQLVASASGVVLGGVAEVVGSNLARGKIFTASIGSVDSLYPSVFINCLNLHQFLILYIYIESASVSDPVYIYIYIYICLWKWQMLYAANYILVLSTNPSSKYSHTLSLTVSGLIWFQFFLTLRW